VPALQKAAEGDLGRAEKGAAYFWLGQANFNLGKFPAAEVAYEKVVDDYGKVEFVDSALLGSGLSAMRQGKNDEARTRLRTLLQKYPQSEDRPRAMLAIAQIDADAKRYPQARSGFEAVLQDPSAKKLGAEVLAPAEDGLIHVLLESGDFAAAESRLEDTLRKFPAGDPQRARASLALGHCRYRQKENEAALTAYQEAAKSTDANIAGEGIYWSGNVMLALDRKVEAGNQLKELPTRFPNHPLA